MSNDDERIKELETRIAVLERGMRFYVNRNIELTEEVGDAKKNLEYWVTQAGMWEAKARSNKESK